MSYLADRLTEEETIKFFKNKYDFFWKRKMNPNNEDWIMVDEYFNKFKEIAAELKE